MLKQLRLAFAVIFALCCQLPSNLQAQNATGAAQTLLELSGLQSQLAQVATAVGAGFDAAAILEDYAGEYSPEALEKIRTSLVEAFSINRLSATVVATLNAELSNRDMQLAMLWYRSELGAKISELEVQRSQVTESKDRIRFNRSLLENPPDDARLHLLAALGEAFQVTEASVSMMIDMQVAVSAAMMNALPMEQRTSIKELVAIFEAQREALIQHYTSESLLSMLYTYESLTPDELVHYTQFARTEIGQSLVHAINLGLHNAMLEASYLLGQALGVVLQESAEEIRI